MSANPALLAAVRARLAAGDGPKAIAAALGVSRGVVAGMLHRHGRGMAGSAAGEPMAPEFILHAPGPGLCCFPLSDGRPWRFCPEPRLRGRAYCAEHQRLCVYGTMRLERAA